MPEKAPSDCNTVVFPLIKVVPVCAFALETVNVFWPERTKLTAPIVVPAQERALLSWLMTS